AAVAASPNAVWAQQTTTPAGSRIDIQLAPGTPAAPVPPPVLPLNAIAALSARRDARPAARPHAARLLESVPLAGGVGQVLLRMGNLLGVDTYVVEVDMDDPQVRVSPMLALGGVPHAESFQNMIARSRPVAAITGTFFGIRNLMPTGDLVIEGQLVW